MKALTIAKHIICKMLESNIEITQLKLQKLLYFTEAYYMAVYDRNELFHENFYAWTYGPVCKEVYNEYKVYMNLPIPEIDCSNLNDIEINAKNSIDAVCNIFGKLSTTQLIKLTHMKDSPWFKTYTSSDIPISKIATKNWFKEVFLNNAKN